MTSDADPLQSGLMANKGFSPITFRPTVEQMGRLVAYQDAFEAHHGIRPGLSQLIRSALDAYLDQHEPKVGIQPKKKPKP